MSNTRFLLFTTFVTKIIMFFSMHSHSHTLQGVFIASFTSYKKL